MKIKKLICLVITFLLITSTFSLQAFAVQDNDVILEGNDFAQDRVIVKLADNSYTTSLDAITNASFGISCSEMRLLNPSNDVVIQFDGTYSTADITETIMFLYSH